MKIKLDPTVAVRLETITVQARGHEFSGFGFARIEGDALLVYDFILLHVGSEGYTEISAETMKALMDHPDHANMRVWLHRHPVGNGVPGPWNWSGMDHATIREAPLGGIPQIVKWSASIVRTPRGWVGRIDNHIKGTTAHVDVEGQAPLTDYQETERLLAEYFRAEEKRRPQLYPQGFEEEDWDLKEYELDDGRVILAYDEEDLAEQLELDVDQLDIELGGHVTILADPSDEESPRSVRATTRLGSLTDDQYRAFEEGKDEEVFTFPKNTNPANWIKTIKRTLGGRE